MTITSGSVNPARLLRGVCPVLSVPFSADGELDLPGFASVVDHVLGTGVTSVLLFGLAGEFAKLEEREKRDLLEVLLSRTRGRGDVAAIASVTDHSAEVAVRRAREYARLGVDVINVLPPSFLGPTQEQVLDHVAAICAAVDVPVVLQYAPGQTGVAISPEQIAALADRLDNLAVVKVESQPPGRLVSQLLQLSHGRLLSLVGYAGLQWPDAHARGAVGVQPGCSATELYVAAQRLLDSGDEAGFRALHTRALPWLSYWMQSVELVVAAEKLVLQQRGIIESAYCRSPRYVLDSREAAAVGSFLAEFREYLP
jgi:4-hydroxy-tetrahydrodipicolinate synthase